MLKSEYLLALTPRVPDYEYNNYNIQPLYFACARSPRPWPAQVASFQDGLCSSAADAVDAPRNGRTTNKASGMIQCWHSAGGLCMLFQASILIKAL